MKSSLKSLFTLIVCVVFISQTTTLSAQTYAKNGMVVSASKISSQTGVDILKQGGNAVDAAIATAFSLAVTHPTAGNIGGGGFMVFMNAQGETTTIDFREKAPLASSETMFLDENWLHSQSILWFVSHMSFGLGFIILTKHLGHAKLIKDEWILLFAMIAVIYIINWSTISFTGIFYFLIIQNQLFLRISLCFTMQII